MVKKTEDIIKKEEMPVIHVQHIALQEGATFTQYRRC
jgi:hypothetical protein